MYKIGEKVKIITWRKRPSHWSSSGDMDYLKRTVVKIVEVRKGITLPYAICSKNNRNGGYWYIKDSDIESSYNEELE